MLNYVTYVFGTYEALDIIERDLFGWSSFRAASVYRRKKIFKSRIEL